MNDATPERNLDAPDDSQWSDLRCAWCAEPEDGEEPCCEACERAAVRHSREQRIEGHLETAARAWLLAMRYRREGGKNDPRLDDVIAAISECAIRIAELRGLMADDAGSVTVEVAHAAE